MTQNQTKKSEIRQLAEDWHVWSKQNISDQNLSHTVAQLEEHQTRNLTIQVQVQ